MLKGTFAFLHIGFTLHISALNQLRMKRIALFTLTLLCMSVAANAQITKGTKLLGGNLSAALSRTDDNQLNRQYGFTFNPSLGFTYKDNHVVGFAVSYGHSDSRYKQTRSESDTYGASVFYRRYLTLGKGFHLFGQANTGYTHYNSDQYSHQSFNGQKSRLHNVGVSLYPGIAFTVNKRIHLELGMNNLVSLNYTTGINKTYYPGFHSETKTSGVNFSTNANPESNLSVGFRIALGKK